MQIKQRREINRMVLSQFHDKDMERIQGKIKQKAEEQERREERRRREQEKLTRPVVARRELDSVFRSTLASSSRLFLPYISILNYLFSTHQGCSHKRKDWPSFPSSWLWVSSSSGTSSLRLRFLTTPFLWRRRHLPSGQPTQACESSMENPCIDHFPYLHKLYLSFLYFYIDHSLVTPPGS